MKHETGKAYYMQEGDWLLLKGENGTVVVRPADAKVEEARILERFHGTRMDAYDQAVRLEAGYFTENSLFDFGLDK